MGIDKGWFSSVTTTLIKCYGFVQINDVITPKSLVGFPIENVCYWMAIVGTPMDKPKPLAKAKNQWAVMIWSYSIQVLSEN